MVLDAGAVIGRVQVRSGHPDGAALRLAVSRQLSSAELRITGAAPSSVLLVRRLADPLPGCITANTAAFAADRRWQGALTTELEAKRRSAARPQQGRIDSAASAVWFADEAELLACLALSLATSHGPPPWWRLAAGRLINTASLTGLLLERLALVSAIFDVLDRWHTVEPVAVVVPDPEARMLVAALVTSLGWGLEAGEPRPAGQGRDDVMPSGAASGSVANARPSSLEPRGSAFDGTRRIAPTAHPSAPTIEPVRAPWHRWWRPHMASSLSPHQELLAGLAIAAARDSTHARSASFAGMAAAWLEGATAAPLQRPAIARSAARVSPGSPRRDDGWGNPHHDERRGPGRERGSASTEASHPRPSARRAPHAEAEVGARRLSPGHRSRTTTESEPASRLQEPSSHVEAPALERTRRQWREEGISTAIGGVLYLINVMERLDLAAFFPANPDIPGHAPYARMLEALARGLLGLLPAELAADPFWAVLSGMDGRELGEPPPDTAPPADSLRIPSSWLEPLAAEMTRLYWAVRGERLCVWCDNGFHLADVPRRAGSPERQAIAEARQCVPQALDLVVGAGEAPMVARGALPFLKEIGWPPALLRWLAFVTPFLCFRLARALGRRGVDDIDVLEDIVRCPGRVYAADTHLELVANMESIRLPLRRAGLDRSPGWVPALGRVVLFHFE